MPSARYEAPRSVKEAIQLLSADRGARVLAGGTDLLVQAKTGRAAPNLYVDVKRIPELTRLEVNAAGIRCGAAVAAARIFDHAEIKRRWPGLAEATDLIGSSQIQGRASWGGNLCNASPAADTVPALIVCNAEVLVAGPKGERTIPVTGFTTGPAKHVLGEGEFVVEFRVPSPAPRTADAYLRLIPRSEMDIAVVGAGVSITLAADGSCSAARVALGAVAPTALLVPDAAAALVGSRLDDAALERAAAAARAAVHAIDDKRGTIAYRTHVAGVLVKRAAKIAAERAASGRN
jgi:carbon-monoxide dehydrogenase medium subunit